MLYGLCSHTLRLHDSNAAERCGFRCKSPTAIAYKLDVYIGATFHSTIFAMACREHVPAGAVLVDDDEFIEGLLAAQREILWSSDRLPPELCYARSADGHYF